MRNPGPEAYISSGRVLPPYAPFGTFSDLLDRITARPPSRIVDSVMPVTSRVIRLQLHAALRYLGLVSSDRAPTDRLKKLLGSQDAERKAVLRETIKQAYSFLFAGFPLGNCTSDELEQEFMKQGASGDTLRKCVAFFVGACREADIEVSAYIKPFRGSRSVTRRRPDGLTTSAKAEEDLKLTVGDLQAFTAGGDRASSVAQLVLQKLPNLDPKWPDKLKSRWFDDLQRLLKILNGMRSS